jgi:putative membrane protein
MDITLLPAVNAALNSICATLLVTGYFFIKRNNVRAHRACMAAAFMTSLLFLISYLTYHFYHGATGFKGTGWVRPLYFTILITHTILAAVIVPFVLMTLYRAWMNDIARHRRVARWTLPMWLYVSVTGVVVYVMLYHVFPSRP